MLIWASLLVAAAPPPARTGLAEASAAFDDAQLRQDGAAIGHMLAPDFIFVPRTGEVLGRDDFIAGASSPDERIGGIEIRDRRIEPLGGDGGVVSGEGLIRGTRKGSPFVSHFRYSDVFARRNGRWLVVYVQVTALPNP
jgi:ketosteroid isomerase-like protein